MSAERPAGSASTAENPSTATRPGAPTAAGAGRWLVKTEPSETSFADVVRDGKVVWDGVSNPLALRHLRAMRAGDLVLVYHTGREKTVTGLARVSRGPYPDPSCGGRESEAPLPKKPSRRGLPGSEGRATGSEGRATASEGRATASEGEAGRPASDCDAAPKRVAVDLEPVAAARTPVPLAAIRAERRCLDLALVRIPRLSVMPVPDAAWDWLLRAGGFAPTA
jgi:predicted RNA-binding protein with PUA-like domain